MKNIIHTLRSKLPVLTKRTALIVSGSLVLLSLFTVAMVQQVKQEKAEAVKLAEKAAVEASQDKAVQDQVSNLKLQVQLLNETVTDLKQDKATLCSYVLRLDGTTVRTVKPACQ